MVILSWVLGGISALGLVGTGLAFIFIPTIAAPIVSKVIAAVLGCKTCLIVAAFVAVALGSYWYGRDGEYDRGHTAAVAEIAAEDDAAVSRALQKRGEWQMCRKGGGTWDQSTGECK